MSTLWTPRGEHEVPRDQPAGPPTHPPTSEPASEPAGPPADAAGGAGELDEEMAQRLRELQQQLVSVPAEQVVTQHMMGLAELAALHLRNDPPTLDEAQLPIDALGLLVEGLGERLSQHEAFTSMLSEIRMAFVAAKRRADETGDGKRRADETGDARQQADG